MRSKIFSKISEIGIQNTEPESDAGKRIIITNRIAGIFFLVLSAGFLMVISAYHITGVSYSLLNTLRPFFAALAILPTFLLNKFRFHQAAKFNLIFASLFFMVYFPLFIGKANGELLIVNTLIVLNLSVATHMIISLKNEKGLYRFVLALLLIHLVGFDLLLLKYEQDDRPVFEVIKRFRFTYTVFKLAAFAFINVVLHYVWNLNHKIQRRMTAVQEDLVEINHEVTQKSIKLREYQEELNAQNAELKAQNEEISLQKEYAELLSQKLSLQNKEILDSIYYAGNLQKAIFPKSEPLKKFTNDCFVFLKPKDILSGDFKWSHSIQKTVWVAAADCTGHGIPGALLSILGISLLNDIVEHDKHIPPNIVLNKLRDRFVQTLRQDGKASHTTDGMDVSICQFDFEENFLLYAGANSPILHIRDGEMKEYKPDRMPVGLYADQDKSFSLQKIPFLKKDRFYLFSDGYRDQFGGEQKKKIKKTVFKDLILASSGYPLKEQKEILQHFFDEWKGHNEQVDDVLLIGVEI